MVKSARGRPKPRRARASAAVGAAAGAATEAAVAQAVEDVMASLAHEIRTPLTGILAISELLAMSELGERERAWVDVLRGSAEHLNALASLVIDAVRAGHKGLVLRRDVFDLCRLAQTAAASLAARAKVKGLHCTAAIAADLPGTVIGDPVRLRAAVENLVDNAVKFTEAGEVRLEVSHENGCVSFAVSDSGIGLSAEEIKRLFRPFVQSSDAVAARFGGAGLGLAFVKRVAQAMGGDVTVASRPGHGSVFRLAVALEPAAPAAPPEQGEKTRPLAPAPAPGAAPPGPAADPPAVVSVASEGAFAAGPAGRERRALNILCAEDNVYGRIVTKTILVDLGHRVAFVGSGAAAVEAVSRNDYDVVLMDVVLAGLDGVEATRRIRMLPGRAGHVPVIGLSGHAAPDYEEKARIAGMDRYLHKPLTPRALADALDELARRR